MEFQSYHLHSVTWGLPYNSLRNLLSLHSVSPFPLFVNYAVTRNPGGLYIPDIHNVWTNVGIHKVMFETTEMLISCVCVLFKTMRSPGHIPDVQNTRLLLPQYYDLPSSVAILPPINKIMTIRNKLGLPFIN